MVMAFFSCEKDEKETFMYSVGNAIQLTQNSDQLSVMDYAEKHVKMSTESLMQFEGMQAEADEAAKAEFAKRMQAINETEFRSMMSESDYYDFVLYRLSREPNGAIEIDRKHYAGTKKIK